MPLYLEVALPLPFRQTFSYLTPSAISPPESPAGTRVEVRFGNRTLIGVVVAAGESLTGNIDPARIKPINHFLDMRPVLSEEVLALCHWAANYYQHPIGEAIHAALPQRFREGKAPAMQRVYRHSREGLGLGREALARLNKQQEIHHYLLNHGELSDSGMGTQGFSKSALKALIEKKLVDMLERPLEEAIFAPDVPILREAPKVLSGEQGEALRRIRFHHYGCYLLEGATGSGKTEVYLQAIAHVLQQGRQALVLIPEIGLTPQTIARFRERFQVPIAELHSAVAEARRAQSWLDASQGRARIIIGTRLASLTPCQDLGIIVVDEEHDASYKQQDGFKYSARDLSIYRANQLGIPIILGSATPSLESLLNAISGKYQHLHMRERAGDAQKPAFALVDLRQQNTLAGLSREALTRIADTLGVGRQVLVFLNRRGFAQALLCHHCGWSSECSACSAKMTLHHQPYHLRCHHCDRRKHVPQHCPNCGSEGLQSSGRGTEQLEQVLLHQFPGIPVLRIDRDSTRSKSALEDKLSAGNQHDACIYIGTQMLAKGHHLPKLDLVVVVDADNGLLSADFRAVEQMSQLLVQVAGRAGRESRQGLVLIQTHRPDHPQLQLLLQQGYAALAELLLQQRRQSELPPYWHLALFRAESKRAELCTQFLNAAKNALLRHGGKTLHITGPMPSAMERVDDRFRFILQVKAAQRGGLQRILSEALKELDQLALGKRTRWSIEVDCLNAY